MAVAINAGQRTRDPVQLGIEFEKRCNKCCRTLPREAFYARPARGPLAVTSSCRECKSGAAAAWNRRNPARFQANQKANHEGVRLAQLKWRSKQPAGWRQKYEDRRDPAERRDREARRRARQRAAFVERVDVRVVFERDAGICGICGETVDVDDFHIDHIVPLARGGAHSYANVQVSHPLCNQRKGAR